MMHINEKAPEGSPRLPHLTEDQREELLKIFHKLRSGTKNVSVPAEAFKALLLDHGRLLGMLRGNGE